MDKHVYNILNVHVIQKCSEKRKTYWSLFQINRFVLFTSLYKISTMTIFVWNWL